MNQKLIGQIVEDLNTLLSIIDRLDKVKDLKAKAKFFLFL